MAQQQGIQVPQLKHVPLLPHFRVASWNSGTFSIISLSVPLFSFIFMFFHWCRFSIHLAPVTHSWMSLTARPEVVVPTLTSQTTATPLRLDFFLVLTIYVIHVLQCVWCTMCCFGLTAIIVCYNCYVNLRLRWYCFLIYKKKSKPVIFIGWP
jgi:hypothetical protein